MSWLVDTSVWSLALRRDGDPDHGRAHRQALVEALEGAELVATTGLILQELLQGFAGPKASARILKAFSGLACIDPDRDDHVAAASLRNRCRRGGVQLGTIDALIAQLAIRHGLTLLTLDQDFVHAARHIPLRLWPASGGH